MVIKYKSLRLVSIIGRSPVVSLIPRSVVPSVVIPDSIMLVPVLGPPWAVWYTTLTLFTAFLFIAAHLVAELAAISTHWAFTLRSISTGSERLVMISLLLSLVHELNLTMASDPSAQAGFPSPLHTGGGKYLLPSVFFPVGLLYTALLPSGQTGRLPSLHSWRLHSATATKKAMATKIFMFRS